MQLSPTCSKYTPNGWDIQACAAVEVVWRIIGNLSSTAELERNLGP